MGGKSLLNGVGVEYDSTKGLSAWVQTSAGTFKFSTSPLLGEFDLTYEVNTGARTFSFSTRKTFDTISNLFHTATSGASTPADVLRWLRLFANVYTPPLPILRALNIQAALDYLISHVQPKSTSKCATYVRLALEAGGLDTTGHPTDAKNYGSFLLSKGFVEVSATDYVAQPGDIVVLQPYPGGNESGHIQMFDGSVWMSDYMTRSQWGGIGNGYEKNNVEHHFYRPIELR